MSRGQIGGERARPSAKDAEGRRTRRESNPSRSTTRERPQTVEETPGRFAVENCAPDCALTGDYSRQTQSLTSKHLETFLECKTVEGAAKNVLRGVSTWLERFAFQACSFNHSDISPFRINKLRAVATNYRTRRSNSGIVRPSRSYSTISRVRRSIVETNCVTPHNLVRSLTAIVVGQRSVAACANFSLQLSSTRRGSCGTDVNGRQNSTAARACSAGTVRPRR